MSVSGRCSINHYFKIKSFRLTSPLSGPLQPGTPSATACRLVLFSLTHKSHRESPRARPVVQSDPVLAECGRPRSSPARWQLPRQRRSRRRSRSPPPPRRRRSTSRPTPRTTSRSSPTPSSRTTVCASGPRRAFVTRTSSRRVATSTPRTDGELHAGSAVDGSYGLT